MGSNPVGGTGLIAAVTGMSAGTAVLSMGGAGAFVGASALILVGGIGRRRNDLDAVTPKVDDDDVN